MAKSAAFQSITKTFHIIPRLSDHIFSQILSHLTMIQTSNSDIEVLLRKVLKSSAFKGGDGDANKRTSRDYDAPGTKGQGDGPMAKENR